jgi:hypothetical protein
MTCSYARIDMRDAGYLGTKLGPYSIRNGQEKMPVKEVYRYCTDEKPLPPDAVAVATTEAYQKVLPDIHQLEQWQLTSAIRINQGLFPAGWNVFFNFCAGRFRDDWKVQSVDTVFLVPGLNKKEEWVEGFCVTPLQTTRSEWGRFIGKQKIPFEEAGHIFFINGVDQLGRARPGDRIVRTMVYLMGRSIASEALDRDQLAPEMSEERIIDAYARLYEINFLASLTINTAEVRTQLEQLFLTMHREEIKLVDQIENTLD